MENQIGPAGRPINSEHSLFQCNICLVPKPRDLFPVLPCCSNKKINRDACASCVATALTVPTDNKCPRCREYVQLVGTVTSERPPYKIVDVNIELGAIEQCLSCGGRKRLIHPSKVCKDCQRHKNGVSDGSIPKILYECQVCHQEQGIPYPIYKTQTTPRHYGNPSWWLCHNSCGGKNRRWRIVESELSKLKKESAPHSWGQYFVRKELDCLPQDPSNITTETKLNCHANGSMSVDVGPGRFVADGVSSRGSSFLVPTHQFPIAESLEDDNDEWLTRKTTLRLKNERTRQIHAVLAHWLPNGYVQCQLIARKGMKSADDVGEEIEAAPAGPFSDEDWLVAVDYLPLLMSQAVAQTTFWSRQEFSIQQAQTVSRGSSMPFFGWNVQPYNVRIGKIGIFAGGIQIASEDSEEEDQIDAEDQQRDIVLDMRVDNSVTALWTDAVGLSISLLKPTDTTDSEDSIYPIALSSDDKHPSIRHFPDGKPLQGSLKVQFSSVSYKTLQGLASPGLGGGLHLALLAPSSPMRNTMTSTEPPDLAESPSLTVEEIQASTVAHMRSQIRKMTLNEKRRRFLHMIVDESHKEQFETNVIGEEVVDVLEPMLENEDFVRRYMQSSSNLEDDDVGWIDLNAEEDQKDDFEEEEIDRPLFAIGYEGSRLVVQDPNSKVNNGWLTNTVRAVRESFIGFGNSNNSTDTVPASNGARVDMDGNLTRRKR